MHDDSKVILSQLLEPMKGEFAREIKKEMKVEEGTSKKKKKPSELHGRAAPSYKLDLKHAAWWQSGFDNTYLQE